MYDVCAGCVGLIFNVFTSDTSSNALLYRSEIPNEAKKSNKISIHCVFITGNFNAHMCVIVNMLYFLWQIYIFAYLADLLFTSTGCNIHNELELKSNPKKK